jgi:hypothetical protein
MNTLTSLRLIFPLLRSCSGMYNICMFIVNAEMNHNFKILLFLCVCMLYYYVLTYTLGV